MFSLLDAPSSDSAHALSKLAFRRCHAFAADIRDAQAMCRSFAAAENVLGSLDIVVANAAIEPTEDDRADRLDIKTWRRVIDTNLTGAFLTAKFGLQALLRSHASDRVLICTVSPTGIRGCEPGQDAYSASKASVLGLMRAANIW
jgi:(+)-trans-carveol dehydrogenase